MLSANLVWRPYLQQLTDTRVIILWTTNTGADSTVRYAPDTTYSSVANGTSRSLGSLGTQLHRVELTGLHPDTTYHYKIYTSDEDLLPEETLSFKTAPYPGSITPFTFLSFGDFGKGDNSQKRLRDRMALDSFNFIFTTGDNAYSDGTYSQFDKNVFQIYSDLFSRAAHFPTLGNHDYHTAAGAPYLDLFDLPTNAWRSGDLERYYSFDYGNAHFVALDSNTPLDVDDNAASDDMFDWLRHDLSQTTQPWIIVALHHAAYSSSSKHGSNGQVQAKLVPIFEQYGVDLVLAGHDHIYERSNPLLNAKVTTVEAGGIVYIVTGAGSSVGYGCGSNESWSAIIYCGDDSYGIYARITLNGATMTIEAIDENGAIKDSYTMSNNSVVIQPLEAVSITGPTSGATQINYTFTATVSPLTATLPITYIWQATGQSPVTHTGGLSDTITYTWQTTAPQTMTVTASNVKNTLTATHHLRLTTSHNFYLPLLLK